VAYELDVPMSTFYNLPVLHEKVVLCTRNSSWREDAHLLYGFISHEERVAFRLCSRSAASAQAAPVGAVRSEPERSGGGGWRTGGGAADQDTRRRQEDRRAGCCWNCRASSRGDRHECGAGCSGHIGGSDIITALQALGYNEKEADWAAKQLPRM